jgi:hypothetical protein
MSLIIELKTKEMAGLIKFLEVMDFENIPVMEIAYQDSSKRFIYDINIANPEIIEEINRILLKYALKEIA